MWIVEDSQNVYERMIIDQFQSVWDPSEWQIGQILAQIVTNLAQIPKILPKATKMVPLYPQ